MTSTDKMAIASAADAALVAISHALGDDVSPTTVMQAAARALAMAAVGRSNESDAPIQDALDAFEAAL